MAREDWLAESQPFFIDGYGRVHFGAKGSIHHELAQSLGISEHSAFASGYYVMPLKGIMWYSNPTRESVQAVVTALRGRGHQVLHDRMTFKSMYQRMARLANPTIASAQSKMAYRARGRDRFGMRRESVEIDMTREELIEELVDHLMEGKFRRLMTHVSGPHALAGSLVGAHSVGWAVGAGASTAHTGKRLKKMDQTQGSYKKKQKAAKKFAQRHPVTATFVLPRGEADRKKLARRGVVGHVAHGALRTVAGGPVNAVRYANKVSYARSGFHRGRVPMFPEKH
jgi:hypothetical protein